MKTCLFSIQLTLALTACYCVCGQGFVYDQQSATSDSGGQSVTVNFHSSDSIGQSFTPSLSSVEFVRLSLADLGGSGGAGATIYVNLWSGSIDTGTLVDSTTPVFLPASFNNYVNFIFPSAVSVTSGSTYYFQPVIQPGGDLLNLGITTGTYPNGTAFFQGIANSSLDLWFREGAVVPEPSTAVLVVLAMTGFCLQHRKIQ